MVINERVKVKSFRLKFQTIIDLRCSRNVELNNSSYTITITTCTDNFNHSNRIYLSLWIFGSTFALIFSQLPKLNRNAHSYMYIYGKIWTTHPLSIFSRILRIKTFKSRLSVLQGCRRLVTIKSANLLQIHNVTKNCCKFILILLVIACPVDIH